MTKKKGWELVIDASVARSAGQTNVPISRHCRETLEGVRDHYHSIVMTDEIRREWDKHKSLYARKWLASMVARKQFTKKHLSASLTIEAFSEEFSDKEIQAMIKDLLLIEAAITADKKILSLDDTVRTLFARLCHTYHPIKYICWFNPEKNYPDILQWLQFQLYSEQNFLLVNMLSQDK